MSAQGEPVRSRQNMPLNTFRSSARRTRGNRVHRLWTEEITKLLRRIASLGTLDAIAIRHPCSGTIAASCSKLVCAALVSCFMHAAGLAAQELPRSTLPGLGPPASRTPVDVNAAPWRGIGVLQTELGFHC